MMVIGIVGLGLIGGSMAKVIKGFTPYQVLGWDIDAETLRIALRQGVIDGELGSTGLSRCDLLLVALYPGAAIRFVTEHAPEIKKDSCVVDFSGVKEPVHGVLVPLAEKQGFHYVGGHPMAGKAQWGFFASEEGLFHNAPMVLIPSPHTPEPVLAMLRQFFTACGFGQIRITTPAEHDEIIAYTSQLSHILSSVYANGMVNHFCQGFTGGSFRDMTRVAALNVEMWAELFWANRENLLSELMAFNDRLSQYQGALQKDEPHDLARLLREGTPPRGILVEKGEE